MLLLFHLLILMDLSNILDNLHPNISPTLTDNGDKRKSFNQEN